MEEKDKVCHLLMSVEEAYKTTVTALEATNSELTLEFVKCKLLDAELKEKNIKQRPTSTNKEYVFNSNSIKCYNCGEPNHFARTCPRNTRTSNNNNQRGRGNYRGNQRGRGNFRENNRGTSENRRSSANVGEEMTFNFVAAQAQSALCNTENEIEFVIDSGASFMEELMKVLKLI